MVPNRIKVGLAGAGWWAVSNHLPVLLARPDVEVAAVCRLGQAELLKVQQAFGIPFGTESFDDLLKPGLLDAVVISTPHQLHGPQAVAALQAGLHVLVEKPLCLDPVDIDRLLVLEKQTGKVVLVPTGWNFQPYMEVAQRHLRENRLGAIRHISGSMASPTGDIMTGKAVRGTESEFFRPDSSAWSQPGTGGYAWGQLVHLLGALFYLTELEPQRVFAMLGKSENGADLYDAAALTFAGGATAALSGSGTVPFGSSYQMDIRIYGERGMLLIDVEEGRERVSLRLEDGTREDVSMAPGDGAYSCVEPVHRFIDLILGTATANPGSAIFAGQAARVVDAMMQSAASGATAAIR